ncbi:MAG: recombinase family protein [Clostridia bacterium]|nr:recombinase family protein [Clostridia bacterium]
MTIYGYARISTPKQSIDRQIRNIKAAYPKAIILQDEFTGTKLSRPNFDKLLKIVVKGDMIVFDSVSRMSRNAADGFAVYQELYNRGVELIFLKEPQINTQTYKKAVASSVKLTGTAVDYILEGINKYLMELAKEQIKLAFEQAEKEVTDLHQRTKEGIITARLNGKQIGQQKGVKLTTKKSVAAKEIIRIHLIDFGGSLNNAECQRLAGISRNSFYKYKQELVLEQEQF